MLGPHCGKCASPLCGPGILMLGLASNEGFGPNVENVMSKNDKMEESYTPLLLEKRTVVDTACAAWHLGRRPQTLRMWACFDKGPVRPIQLYGRLAWRVEDIRRVLGA